MVTKELENYFEDIYPILILYCDFLRELDKHKLVEKILRFERAHYDLVQVMEAIDEEEDLEKWCDYSNKYPIYSTTATHILKQINKDLVKIIFHNS